MMQRSDRPSDRLLSVLEAAAGFLWTGACVGFVAQAPVAFATIESRDLFATFTQRALARVSTLSYLGASVAACAAVGRAARSRHRSRPLGRAVLGAAAIAAVAYQQRTIVPAMTALRAEMDRPFGQVPASDPLRRRYDELHHRSTRVFGLALLLGLTTATLAVRHETEPRTADGMDSRA